MLSHRAPRRLVRVAAAALGLTVTAVPAALAFARGSTPAPAKAPASPPPKADVRSGKIPEIPTTISVPVSATRSLVVSIPGRLFHQCPRNATTPTTFEGDGTILQNVWNENTGNSHGMAYVGAIPVPGAESTTPFLQRAQAESEQFVARFNERYARLELVRLVTAPSEISLAKTTVKVDGKPVPCWRTPRFQTALAGSGMSNKRDAPLGSEALLLPDAVSGCLCYLIVDSKGRLSLEQLLDGLAFRTTADVNPKGRVVPLNDISYGLDGRFPIRLGWYTSPPGFAPTLETCRATGELVYGEQRLDANGAVTGAHRIEHRDTASVPALEEQAEMERSLHAIPADVTARSVPLAAGSGSALVFAWTPKAAARPTRERVAVLEVDDKVWTFVWTTVGDEALAKADDAAFDTLLASMSLAVR